MLDLTGMSVILKLLKLSDISAGLNAISLSNVYPYRNWHTNGLCHSVIGFHLILSYFLHLSPPGAWESPCFNYIDSPVPCRWWVRDTTNHKVVTCTWYILNAFLISFNNSLWLQTCWMIPIVRIGISTYNKKMFLSRDYDPFQQMFVS